MHQITGELRAEREILAFQQCVTVRKRLIYLSNAVSTL